MEEKKDLEEIIHGDDFQDMSEALKSEEKPEEDAPKAPAPETEAAPAPQPEYVPSMDDMKDELEKSFRVIHVGDVLKGTVVDVDETGVLLDLDYYAPGRIPAEEMSNDPHFEILQSVKIGDEISATVTKKDDGYGNILLSRKEADDTLGWDRLIALQEAKTVITGKITEVTKGGAILYVEGVRGFIPASRLALTYVDDPSEYLNREVSVQVTEVDKEKEKLILSAKELLQEKAIEEKNKKISRMEPGNIVEGTVESLKDYGAFVNIGDGISGLVHISQISEKKIKHPKVVLKEGQKVKVLITKIENGKISLSIKGAMEATAKEQVEEETEYHEDGQATTSLADLFRNLKF